MSKDTGGPAFPVVMSNDRMYPNEHQVSHTEFQAYGISMRDYFAAKAMQAFITAHISHYGHENHWEFNSIAAQSYDMADAMLEARK